MWCSWCLFPPDVLSPFFCCLGSHKIVTCGTDVGQLFIVTGQQVPFPSTTGSVAEGGFNRIKIRFQQLAGVFGLTLFKLETA